MEVGRMPPFWTAPACPRLVALAPRELTESLTTDHTDGTDEVVEAAVSAAIPVAAAPACEKVERDLCFGAPETLG